MKKNKLIISVIILIIMFLGITGLVIFNKTLAFDNMVYNLIRSFECDFFDKYFVFITRFGDEIVIFMVVVVLMLIFRNKDGWLLGILTINSALTNQLVKHIIRRPRPDVLKLVKQGGYSYPSGHTMIAIAVYGYLFYFVFKRVQNKYLKYPLCMILGLLILSVGISRIYVGVHYATDVIAGFIFSILQVILIIKYSNKYFRGN